MGLDVFVGPLVRYYTGNWQLITQQAAAAAGIEMQVVRANPVPDDAITDPEVVRQAIFEWRSGLRDQNGKQLAGADWTELPQGEYWTDKPDWDGYWAVRLLAGSEEFPGVTVPPAVPPPASLNEVLKGPLAQRINEVYQFTGGGLIRGLLGRAPKVSGDRYPNVHLPELWLPAAIDSPFAGRDVAGNPMIIGSVDRLLDELEALNDRTLRGDVTSLATWQREGVPSEVELVTAADGTQRLEDRAPGDRSLTAVARFGLAVFLTGARYAATNRLPIRLDY